MSPSGPSEDAASLASLASNPASPRQTAASTSATKISCLACRAAKRRCQTTDAFSTCRRCSSQGLACEYRKHNRGRKRKNQDEVDAARTMAFELGGTSAHGDAHRERGRSQTYRGELQEAGETPLDLATLLGQAGGSATLDPRAAPPSSTVDVRPVRPLPSPRPPHDPTGRDAGAHIPLTLDPFAESTPCTLRRSSLSQPSDPPRRVEIQFSHVVPVEGDSSPYLPGIGRDAPDPAPSDSSDTRVMGRLLRQECPDPVTAGLLTEPDAFHLFEYYFSHLNITLCILDPVLHTVSSTRSKSPILFSAVLTVAAKIRRPKAYAACLMICNKLLGQAVEFGLCSLALVQAIVLLTHWKKPDDRTSWRRVGYAIRMAQELRLNIKGSRPLSRNERGAREVLNRERAWLNLIIADYHLAIHHSLPRMIADEGIDDPTDWIMEHPQLPCPGESTLAPWITFSRMCRLYADLLAGMNGDQSNMRALAWIELEWKRWRAKWLERSQEFGFLRPQISTIRLCDSFYRFHIAEYTLLYNARYKSQGVLSMEEITPMSLAFAECIDAALAIGSVFQEDFFRWGFLPYCFNLVWVALAVSSVWLFKNIVLMSHIDRARVIKSLSDIQHSSEEASCSSDDMAAYMHRLAKHLLAGISPEWQLSSLVSRQMEPTPPDGANGGGVGSISSALETRPVSAASGPPAHDQVLDRSQNHWAPATVSQIIQDQLWNQNTASGSQEGSLFLPNGQTAYVSQQQCDLYAGNGQTEQIVHHSRDGNAQLQDELLFPAADDDFWRILFPDNAQPTLPSIM